MAGFVMVQYGAHVRKAPRLKRVGPSRLQDAIEFSDDDFDRNPPPIGHGGKTGFPTPLLSSHSRDAVTKIRWRWGGCCTIIPRQSLWAASIFVSSMLNLTVQLA